jgi:hypothetical protein
LAHPNAPNCAPLCTITLALLAAASNVASSVEWGVVAGNLLLSLPRKTHKTLHQQQIGHQNARKQKAVHDLAHACATSLVAKARVNADKENQPRMTTQVIAQVEGEFRSCGFKVVLLKPTTNRYIRD